MNLEKHNNANCVDYSHWAAWKTLMRISSAYDRSRLGIKQTFSTVVYPSAIQSRMGVRASPQTLFISDLASLNAIVHRD